MGGGPDTDASREDKVRAVVSSGEVKVTGTVRKGEGVVGGPSTGPGVTGVGGDAFGYGGEPVLTRSQQAKGLVRAIDACHEEIDKYQQELNELEGRKKKLETDLENLLNHTNITNVSNG